MVKEILELDLLTGDPGGLQPAQQLDVLLRHR
jgi:hypothetical protein